MSAKIHFLNVGHGDCTIIENFDTGRTTVIDINTDSSVDNDDISIDERLELLDTLTANDSFTKNAEAQGQYKQYYSPSDPMSYMADNLSSQSIFRFVQSHPDMDHMTGLSNLYYKYKFNNYWTQDHDVTKSSMTEEMALDWNFHIALKDGDTGKFFLRGMHDGYSYWPDDGFRIIHPTQEWVDKNKPNNMSYALMFEHNGFKAFFPGDIEVSVWKELLDSEYATYIEDLNILKASHHGRMSGYHKESVEHMNPEYSILSVGKKTHTDAQRLYQYRSRKQAISTRHHGNITIDIDSYGGYSIDSQRGF
jgi:beta-lactamase superfamily II metal-dependent hydrolase